MSSRLGPRWCALALAVLFGAAMAACSDDGPGEGEASLEVDGRATVERADGDRETVDDSTDLGRGDRVWVTEGEAVMHLHGGATLELRAALEDDDDHTQVLMGSPPVLEAGDLLVTAPDTTTVEADGTDVVVREGGARLTRAFGMSASAYDADLELDSAGVAAEVPALRQVAVPDLGRPRPARPVVYNETDPWDQRFLGAAMTVDDELRVLAESLTGQLPAAEGRTVGFLRLVFPGLEDEDALESRDIAESLVDRSAGENVIGAAITDLGERGSFDERWDEVFGFRDEGAAWGIVALDQAVQSQPLIGSVEQAFNTSFDEVVQAPTSTPPPGGGEEPGGTDTGGTDEPDGTDSRQGDDDGGTDGGDGGTDPPVTPPTTPTIPPLSPPSDEPPAELDPIVDPVADLVEDLLGGLLG